MCLQIKPSFPFYHFVVLLVWKAYGETETETETERQREPIWYMDDLYTTTKQSMIKTWLFVD